MAGDPVAEACAALAGYMATLEELVGEPSGPGVASPAARSRAASVPEPYGQAGRVLMTAHEGIRRLLADLRLVTAGHTGRRLGGSDEVTAAVLAALPKLAAGLDCDEDVAAVVGFLDRWIGEARSVPGIDENRRWRHLPRQDDGRGLPPKCPYCGCMFLLADLDAGVVACSVPRCEDSAGQPPVATLRTDDSGRPVLAWADGKIERAPDLEAAGRTGTAGRTEMDDDDLTAVQSASRDASLQRALAEPMPRGLRDAVGDLIEPHTINMCLKHGDVMCCIDVAFPLIREWLRGHPEEAAGG